MIKESCLISCHEFSIVCNIVESVSYVVVCSMNTVLFRHV